MYPCIRFELWAILLVTIWSYTTKEQTEMKMSGLHWIQMAMYICIMGGYYGQPLYEDKCTNNLVDGMDQRLKEAYGKI